MADREKVIKALTECIFLHENPDDEAGCLECPYRPDEKGTCPTMIPFLKDVLELLKEQEPVRVSQHWDDTYGDYANVCECGNHWISIDGSLVNYCPGCGMAVRLDADGA